MSPPPGSGLCLRAVRIHGSTPLDLDVAPGECALISGPSGAGKTLLLRAIADLDPHEGAIQLDGVDRESFAPAAWRRAVGLLPAESAWWRDTVGEHFEQRVPSTLAELGFPDDAWEWAIARLSSGERQRLALLRLLALEPRALLLDEPTSHLDAESSRRVRDCIERYRARTQACVLWVTHALDLAEQLDARTLWLERGVLGSEKPCG